MAAVAVCAVDRLLWLGHALFHPQTENHRRGAGRRAFTHDRSRHRCVQQHHHGEVVLTRQTRIRIRPQRDARIHGYGVRANASGHETRIRQPYAEYALGYFHRRFGLVAVAKRANSGRRTRRCDRNGAASERPVALDYVGNRAAIRADWYDSGRHEHIVQTAHGTGCTGGTGAKRIARLD